MIYLAAGSAFPHMWVEEILKENRVFRDPLLGEISTDQFQIGPQNTSLGKVIDEEYLNLLSEMYPSISFRLHANVRLFSSASSFDGGTTSSNRDYLKRLVEVLRFLGKPYIFHAGRKSSGKDLREQLRFCQTLEQAAGVSVGIELLYPTSSESFTASTWEEYEQTLNSGVHFALDLSHVNILFHYTQKWDEALIQDMLESPNCIEVHLSGNDGKADRHLPLCQEPVWWEVYLRSRIQGDIFYEGYLVTTL